MSAEFPMLSSLPTAHRIAQINYLPRTAAFAYAFLVVELLAAERAFSGWVIVFGVLLFLVYPQLAYVHARYAMDSKRAEFRNLNFDSLLLGAWTAVLEFPLWVGCGFFIAVCLNGAAHGGARRFAYGIGSFAAGALAAGAIRGFPYAPGTGALVSAMAALGIAAYVSWIGFILNNQNRRLLRARNALRTSEEQFRFIADHAGDYVAVLDAQFRIRYASPLHLKHFAPSAVESGAEWLELVHPDDRQRARNFLRGMADSGTGDRVALRFSPASGPSRAVECEGNPAVDPQAGAHLMIVVSHDVTEHVRADIDLRLAAHAFNELADGVLISDGSGRIEYVNQAFTALTGYETSELLGRRANELKLGLQADQLLARIWDTLARTGGWRGRYMGQRKNGEYVVLWGNISAVRDAGGTASHYVWVITDASRQTEVEPA